MSTVDEKRELPAELAEPKRDATVMEIATVVADSRAFPDCRNPAAAAVRILAGKEMGVGPIASVIGIRVQAGRVSMDAALIAGCIKRSGKYDYQIAEHTEEKCELEFFEGQDAQNTIDGRKLVGKSTFTMADAKKAGLAGKDTWKAYPRNMMFARAMTNGARWYCPAIFGGAVYSHEELGYAVDEEGRAAGGNGDGDYASDLAGNGSDLCTRDQRQEIARLVEAAGKSMPGFLAEMGIKLLDELSAYEAGKAMVKLKKAIAKKEGNAATARSEAKPAPQAEKPAATPAAPALTPPTDPPLSPAQQMIADAQDESRRPSTVDQERRIIELAQLLDLEPTDIEAVLAKRNCEYISQLSHLQAAVLIENMEEAAKAKAEQPPFDPDPPTGNPTGK